MFLLLKQAVKGYSVTARRCKSAVVEDWNKNLLGWMVCHRVINLTDTHFGNCLLGSYRKQIHKAGRKTPSMEPKSRYLLHGRKQNLKMLLGKKKELTESFFPRCVLLLPRFLGGGGGGSAFSCINSASDTNSLLCKIQHANSESKTL